MNKRLRDNLLFLIIAHVCWLSQPAIVLAQDERYHPVNFTQPLSTARGVVTPIGPDAIYLEDAERCTFLVKEFGWEEQSCTDVNQMLLNMGPIDTLLVNAPVSDGYVSLDDFTGDTADEVDAITESYTASIQNQAKALGVQIEFLGWRLYPQVDRDKSILYFANMLDWDGEKTMNISVVLFDRYGYVPMKVVPRDSELSAEQLKGVVEQAVAVYKPNVGSSYFHFESGDKVASYGALSVFAGILGVKYGKAATAGLLVIAAIFLKKAWFLLLLPLVWIVRLFRKTRPSRPT
ncbi:MAG TPA: DUF2167 domain-containing protein [Rhizobiaceae bacterium]|nr:DUF2167 domain-containing protein [Rhizobiaceae bacterium]